MFTRLDVVYFYPLGGRCMCPLLLRHCMGMQCGGQFAVANADTWPRAEWPAKANPESHFRFPFGLSGLKRTPRPSASNSTPPFSSAVLIARRLPASMRAGMSFARSAVWIEPTDNPHSLASLSADQRRSARAARIWAPEIIPPPKTISASQFRPLPIKGGNHNGIAQKVVRAFPGLQRLAPETIESHTKEQELRDANFAFEIQLHDLRSEFLHREGKLRADYLARVAEIAAWRKGNAAG
jgi:hypothetical protein